MVYKKVSQIYRMVEIYKYMVQNLKIAKRYILLLFQNINTKKVFGLKFFTNIV